MGEPLRNLLHLAGRSPRAQRNEQPLTGLARAFRDHLDPPIGQVGRMADQA
jgi:hypothetical protein